ncbi:MAG: hypothetical protein ACRENE_30790 [Polyangiaceae bacterium]
MASIVLTGALGVAASARASDGQGEVADASFEDAPAAKSPEQDSGASPPVAAPANPGVPSAAPAPAPASVPSASSPREATSAASTCAAASEARLPASQEPRKERVLPPRVAGTIFRGGAHSSVGGSIGNCLRLDPQVPANGACGDVSIGFAELTRLLALDALPGSGLRVGLEGGLGGEPANTWGFGDLGPTEKSGGPFLLARMTVGYDWTPLFFMQLGGQASYGWESGSADVAGLAELGTRVFRSNIEVGARELVGVDWIAQGGFMLAASETTALAYGTTAFARVTLP